MLFTTYFTTALLVLAGSVAANPSAAKHPGIDLAQMHNKVRSGAAAVANQENPRCGRIDRVAYQNGEQLAASQFEIDEPRKRVGDWEEEQEEEGDADDNGYNAGEEGEEEGVQRGYYSDAEYDEEDEVEDE